MKTKYWLMILSLALVIALGASGAIAQANLLSGGQTAEYDASALDSCDPCVDGELIFGPETFQRVGGAPETVTESFYVPLDRDVCISVTNNGCEAAWVTVDDSELITPPGLKSGGPFYQTTIPLGQGEYELSVRLGSAAGCSLEVEMRACELEHLCSEVATNWCEAKGWQVAASNPAGSVVCTAPGYDEYANCEECGIYNIVVWEDGAGDPLCPGGLCSTLAGRVYGGHDPCECGDNLRYCGTWDMQGCIPDPYP